MKSSAQDTPDASQEASRYSLPAKPNSKMNTAGAQRQRAPPCYDQRSEAPAERSWLIQDDRPATSNQSQPVAQALAAPSAGSLAWSQHACSGHSAFTTACYLFHLCRFSRYLDVPCGTSGSILIEIRLKSFLPLPVAPPTPDDPPASVPSQFSQPAQAEDFKTVRRQRLLRVAGWFASQDFCRAAFVAVRSRRPQAGPHARPAPQGKNVL